MDAELFDDRSDYVDEYQKVDDQGHDDWDVGEDVLIRRVLSETYRKIVKSRDIRFVSFTKTPSQ